MTTNLTNYISNLEDARLKISDTQTQMSLAHKAVSEVENALEKLETLEKNTEKLESIAKNLETAMKFVAKFGSFGKIVGEAIEPVLKAVRKRIEDLNDKTKEVKSTFGRYEDAAETMRIAIEVFQFDLNVKAVDIDSYMASLTEAKDVLNNDITRLPAGFADTLAAIEADFAAENGKYADIQADMEAMRQKAITLATDTLPFVGLVSSVEFITDGFNDIVDVFGFLDKPLQILADALSPVEWILDAAEAIFDKVFNPILDPIKEAFNIDELLDKFSDTVTGFLPSVDGLNPFQGLEDTLDRVFGSATVPSLFDEVTAPWDQEPTIETSIVGRLFGENGLLAAAQGGGEFSQNFFAARNDILSERSTITGTNDGDILSGGPGDDVMEGGLGYNIFIAGTGDDTIYGAGQDAVFFKGALPNYAFSWSEDETDFFFEHENTGGDDEGDGNDDIFNAEWFVFSDGSFTANELASAIFTDPGQTFTPGTSGSDIIFGNAEDNSIDARGGNDNIYGGDGKDTVNGGSGNDTYSYAGESFGDPVFFDDGAVVVLDSGASASLLAQRTDILTRIENVFGSRDNDTIIGSSVANVLIGAEGSDKLFGGLGADTLYGGDQSDVLVGGRGNDVMYSGRAVDVFIGGLGNDTMVSSPVRDGVSDFDLAWYGGGLSDLLQLDLLTNYTNDFLPLDPNLLIDLPHHLEVDYRDGEIKKFNAQGGLLGTDTLVGVNLVVATDNDDVLRAGAGAAAIDADGNRVNPRGVALEGAAGDDTFYGYEATDADLILLRGSTFMGGAGNDTLFGYNADDIFVGGAGDDTYKLLIDEDNHPIRVGKGHFFGGNTNVFDTEQPHSGGLDHVDAGHDILDFSATGYRWTVALEQDVTVGYDLTVDLDDGDQNARHAATIEVYGIEEFIGSAYEDTFVDGDGIDHTFHGRGGDDLIRTALSTEANFNTGYGGLGDDDFFGGAGTDTFYGGAGNDYLAELQGSSNNLDERNVFFGGAGDDIFDIGRAGVFDFYGGAGFDILSLGGLTDGVDVDMASGIAALGSRLVDIEGFEAFRGTQGDDSIAGTGSGDVLAAAGGNDSISGLGGNDVIYGSNGDNRLFGGSGSDMIFVGRGDNTVDGGTGFDTLNLQPDQLEITRDGWQVSDTPLFDGQWDLDLNTGILRNIDSGTVFGTSTVDRIQSVIGGAEGDTLKGRNGEDIIDGGDGGDTIEGRSGADALTGGAGDDIVYGGGGADVVVLGTGDDSADGGGGTDTLQFDQTAAVNVVDLGIGLAVALDETGAQLGTDRFTGFEDYRGGAGSEVLRGSSDDDLAYGGSGDDTLIGLDGRDDLRGGKGHDVLVGDGSVTPALLSLNDGSNNTDRLQAQGAGVLPTGDLTFEMLINAADPGTQEACLFSYASSSAVSNAFTLFNSNQQLRIIVNNTVVDTGVPTSELMNGTANRISVTLDADTDTMQLFVNGAIMWQGVEPAIGAGLATGGILVIGQDQDTLGGGFNPNQATDGAVGDIRVWNSVRSARDIAEAAQTGVPADAIGLSAYWVVGDDGRMDPLVGPDMALIGPGGVTPAGTTGGSDVLRGGQGDDQLFGGDGNDTLDGGADNDTLEGGRGSDRLDGGNGLDVASYADTGVALRVDLNDATQNTGRAASDTLISIEGVIGSQGDDTLFGSDEGNILRGSGGDDRIVARGGDDTLSGGEGADILDGNGGDDWVDFTGEGSVTADLQFNARNLGSAAGDEYRRIEHLMAGDGDDDLRGDGTDNSISGGDGADTLTGRGGADVILGGAGRDTLEGGAGADVLVGGGDTNLLYGGSGADTLRHGVADGGPRGNDDWYGGSGADIFEFDNTTEDDHFAHIWDFGRGSDTIRIIGAEYDDLTIGDVDSQKAFVILEQNTLIFVEGVQAADLTEDKFEFV